MSGLQGGTYEEKLIELNLEPLTIRREKADMTQVFKILNKFDDIDAGIWFRTYREGNRERNTRLTEYPNNLMRRTVSRTDVHNKFFSQRVINPWNMLPVEIKDAKTIGSFKAKLNKHYKIREDQDDQRG